MFPILIIPFYCLESKGPLRVRSTFLCVYVCKSRENHFPGVDNQPNVHNKKSCLVWSDTKLLLLVFSALCILKNLIQKKFLGYLPMLKLSLVTRCHIPCFFFLFHAFKISLGGLVLISTALSSLDI